MRGGEDEVRPGLLPVWTDQVNFYFELNAFYAFNMQINYSHRFVRIGA